MAHKLFRGFNKKQKFIGEKWTSYLYFVFCILYAYLENIHTIQQVMALHNTNWPLLENTWDTTIDMYKSGFFGWQTMISYLRPCHKYLMIIFFPSSLGNEYLTNIWQVSDDNIFPATSVTTTSPLWGRTPSKDLTSFRFCKLTLLGIIKEMWWYFIECYTKLNFVTILPKKLVAGAFPGLAELQIVEVNAGTLDPISFFRAKIRNLEFWFPFLSFRPN